MPDARPNFVRLARGPRYNSLWLAPDHLLWVTAEGFITRWSEKYARFYLRDIEALLIVPSGEWKAASILLGLFGLGALPMALLAWDSPPVGAVWLGAAAVILLWLAVRLIRGRGVVLHVQTGAGTVATSVLPRPRAQRLLAELAAQIEAAQTDLPPLKRATSPGTPGVGQVPLAPPHPIKTPGPGSEE